MSQAWWQVMVNQGLAGVKGMTGSLDTVAAGVHRLRVVFVNCYLVEAEPGRGGAGDASGSGGWVLVDSGLPRLGAAEVKAAAEGLFGPGSRPTAIVLTHGHFDHAGSAGALAEAWDVPIYAHEQELPFLTGRSDYPPQDPSIGGAISQMSRAFPHGGYDLRPRVRPLPADGSVPGLPGWTWLHTPGHSPGHVSLWQAAERLVLAGDAVATTDLDAWLSQATWQRRLDRPPAPFTPDWPASQRSVAALADLEPQGIAAGHGHPMFDADLPQRLRKLADDFPVPVQGRYANESARYDPEQGTVWVPPPVDDPAPRRAAGVAGVALGALTVAGLATWLASRRK